MLWDWTIMNYLILFRMFVSALRSQKLKPSKSKEIITVNKFKQIAAFILIFLGWMFVVSGVGWLMNKGWIFFLIFTPIGAALLFFGKKLNEPFAWAAKVKKIERKRRIADERKAAFESRQAQ